MPVKFQTPSESEGVVVKKLSVSDDAGGTATGSLRNKFTINIRILPHKKQRPKVAQKSSKINLSLCQHRCHHPQQQGGRPTTAKRTRFSCWSAEEDDVHHLHHYDVADNDVTYWSTAATASRVPHSSCDACDDSRLLRCNDDKDTDDDHDDGRRRRSYRTAQNFVFTGHCDAPAAGDSDLDEVFEDLSEKGADSGHYREALRSMNAGSAPDQRRQRVSQPPPPRHRPGGPRAGASNAVTAQGRTERKPALVRRALTDLEAAEIAAGYPEVYYVGDTATVNAAETARRRAAAKKTQDSGAATREEESKKTYDDDEGYYIHVPHDQIAYR